MPDLKAELVKRLEAIPGVAHEAWPDREDGFSTVRYRGQEIAHFHGFDEIDLRLGKALIRQQGLKHNPDSAVHPKRSVNSSYIEVRFTRRTDLDRIVALVRLLVETD